VSGRVDGRALTAGRYVLKATAAGSDDMNASSTTVSVASPKVNAANGMISFRWSLPEE
jgi:hypothetical protein